MVTSKTASLLMRILALSLALVAHAPPVASAPAALFQAGPPRIPIPNLVGYWSMDSDTAGVVQDRTPNANDGSLSGTAAISTAEKPAVPSGNPASLALPNNANSLLTVPDSASLSLTGQFTVAAWIRPTVAPGGSQKGIIEKWDGPTAHAGYFFRLTSSNNLSFSVCHAAGNTNISTVPRAIATNTWSHVAATNGAGNAMTLYVNGDDDDTTGVAAGPPTDGVSDLLIGASYSAQPFGGHIDEARVYNRALTMAEIGILMNGQPAPTGLVATGGNSQVALSWTAPVGSVVPPTYAVLRGTSTGVYTTLVTSGLTGTTYSDPTVTPGTPYHYVVVAVTVMASAASNEQVATANNIPPAPPPPPPAPRTSKVGGEDNPCGCGTVSPSSGGLAALGLLVALMTLAPGLFRRG